MFSCNSKINKSDDMIFVIERYVINVFIVETIPKAFYVGVNDVALLTFSVQKSVVLVVRSVAQIQFFLFVPTVKSW